MTYDPDAGHYRGADGTPRGFNPAQGVAAASNPILADIRWWFTFAGGGFTDSVSGKSLTAVTTPTSEVGPAGGADTAMGLTYVASN